MTVQTDERTYIIVAPVSKKGQIHCQNNRLRVTKDREFTNAPKSEEIIESFRPFGVPDVEDK